MQWKEDKMLWILNNKVQNFLYGTRDISVILLLMF